MSSSSPGPTLHSNNGDVGASQTADNHHPPGPRPSASWGSHATRPSISSSSSSKPWAEQRVQPSDEGSADANGDADVNSSLNPLRTSNRQSGGFLLDGAGSLQQKSPHDIKGKRKSEDSPLVVPKTRLRSSFRLKNSSIGSSPLSKQILPSPTPAQSSFGSPPSRIGNVSINGNKKNKNSTRFSSSSTSPVGLDPDPAQIVNMALILSNARKRKASERRYASTELANSRGMVLPTTPNPQSPALSNSLVQYVPSTPQMSPETSGEGGDNSQRDDVNKNRAPTPTPPILEDNTSSPQFLLQEDGQPIEISPATVHRVQKAKTYFELAYEHRRLLSHLPPVARPGSNTQYQSKQYNPLQYIRNRKLRVWDKTAFDPEEDGWHDVDKVRGWVTSVIESHPETTHEPDECMRLPPLSKPASGTESDSDAKRLKQAAPQKLRRRRPRSDWVTHPGDLIADCFWLEQGVNKYKILDRDNHHIYPPETQFHFSGWRKTSPLEVPEGLQEKEKDQTRPLPNQTRNGEDSPRADALFLPSFKSVHNQRDSHDDHGKLRRHQKRKHNKIRHKGLKMFMEDFNSGSESSRSPGASEDEADRGRKRMVRIRQKNIHSDESSAAVSLVPPTNTLLSSHDDSRASSVYNSAPTSLDHTLLSKLRRDSAKVPTPNRSRNRNGDPHQIQEPISKKLAAHDLPRSSAEYESTAPNSPMVTATKPPVWPSIVINLDSPPQSRAPSPAKKSKTLNPFQDRSTSSKPDGVSKSDFAVEYNEPEFHSKDLGKRSGTTTPGTRETSPFTHSRTKQSANGVGVISPGHASDLTSPSNAKTTSPSAAPEHARIRGIFKSGRIAELVGTEVSRVSHFIRKREPASHGKQDSTSTRAYDSAEERDLTGSGYRTPSHVRLHSSSSTLSNPPSGPSPPVAGSRPTSSSADRPAYYNAHLPSFTSPFERDKEKQDLNRTSLNPTGSFPGKPDHISRQAAERRSVSRSPRLDQLAPPKLDTSRSASPVRVNELSHVSGELPDLTNSRAASDKLNSMMRNSGENINAVLPRAQSLLDLSRVSSRDVAAAEEAEPITIADIHRVRALILSSAIKAREIGRRADVYRNAHQKQGLNTVPVGRGKGSHHVDLGLMSRRQDHVVAVRSLILALTEQGATLDSKMKQFSSTTAPGLHRHIQELEDRVDNQVTPRVRDSVDKAGELSTKLNLSSTLAVKNVNDTINQAFRKRRRGPLRSIRRGFFAGIEYTVVALLWAIWAIVTVLSIFVRIVKGLIKLARWLLFLD